MMLVTKSDFELFFKKFGYDVETFFIDPEPGHIHIIFSGIRWFNFIKRYTLYTIFKKRLPKVKPLGLFITYSWKKK